MVTPMSLWPTICRTMCDGTGEGKYSKERTASGRGDTVILQIWRCPDGHDYAKGIISGSANASKARVWLDDSINGGKSWTARQYTTSPSRSPDADPRHKAAAHFSWAAACAFGTPARPPPARPRPTAGGKSVSHEFPGDEILDPVCLRNPPPPSAPSPPA